MQGAAALALAALVGLWAPAASADVLLFSSTTTEQTIQPGTVATVSFGGTPGATQLNFSTAAANTRVVIIFDAVCAINGAAESYASIVIRFDPAGSALAFDAPPTKGGARLCSGGSAGVAASIVAVVRPATAGTHSVLVQINPASEGSTAGTVRLTNRSLTVIH
jgi:hypothetical protein